MTKLTPTKAIREHCRVMCMNNSVEYCIDRVCVLKNIKLKVLERIKIYCRVCKFPNTVKSCDGIILNTLESQEYGKCPLHRYRFGKDKTKH